MPSEGPSRRAPTPLRRPAVQPAPPARGVGAARTGPSPADLQLRLGNRGTQAFLEQFAPARAGTAEPRDDKALPVAQGSGAAGLTENAPRAATVSAAASVATLVPAAARDVRPKAIPEQIPAAVE